ncbi:MAG: polysaccharide biosynthesis/export family protein [Bacteroidales bacterium]|nr:polysaccharide biosynthesis/export family protein [Bacteroidales bacterium]
MYLQDQKPDEIQDEYDNVRPEKTIQPFDNIYIKVSSIDEKTANIFADQGRGGSESNINLLSYTVNQSGYIDFPFVGEIYVKDMTLQEAQQTIETEVSEYLTNISITVKFVNNTVAVLGEVTRPGEYSFYRDQITIFQAISFAGGFKDFGNKTSVILVREAKNKLNYYYLDLTDKDIVSSEYYYIIPNDAIIVKPINQKYRNLRMTNLPLFLSSITTIVTVMTLYFTIIQSN